MRRFVDTIGTIDQWRLDAEAGPHLDALEKKLAGLGPKNFHGYQATWQVTGISDTHVAQLCNDVERRLTSVIQDQIAELKKLADEDREVEAQENFRQERAANFIGRVSAIQRLEAYAHVGQATMTVVGESGSGKSALLAKFIGDLQASPNSPTLIYRFVGATAHSTNLRSLLSGICRQIRDDGPLPQETAQLILEFSRRLSLATESRPIVVVIDALDQLDPADDAPASAGCRANSPRTRG